MNENEEVSASIKLISEIPDCFIAAPFDDSMQCQILSECSLEQVTLEAPVLASWHTK